MSFSLQSNNLLNFKICSFIINKYMIKYNLKINSNENEIDISDDICLDLFVNLLNEEEK